MNMDIVLMSHWNIWILLYLQKMLHQLHTLRPNKKCVTFWSLHAPQKGVLHQIFLQITCGAWDLYCTPPDSYWSEFFDPEVLV